MYAYETNTRGTTRCRGFTSVNKVTGVLVFAPLFRAVALMMPGSRESRLLRNPDVTGRQE